MFTLLSKVNYHLVLVGPTWYMLYNVGKLYDVGIIAKIEQIHNLNRHD